MQRRKQAGAYRSLVGDCYGYGMLPTFDTEKSPYFLFPTPFLGLSLMIRSRLAPPILSFLLCL
jgi:hypothetical protein